MDDVARRLSRAGVPEEQVRHELATFEEFTAEEQAEYRDWLQRVSDTDIVEAVASGVAPVNINEEVAGGEQAEAAGADE